MGSTKKDEQPKRAKSSKGKSDRTVSSEGQRSKSGKKSGKPSHGSSEETGSAEKDGHSKVERISDKNIVEEKNPCEEFLCENGGSCEVDSYGAAYCICEYGFTGLNCQTGKLFILLLFYSGTYAI